MKSSNKKNKKILLLLDIDYVLFDTDLYREYLYTKLAIELGYKGFEEFYPIAKKASNEMKVKIGHYDPNVLLRELIHFKKNTIQR